MKTLLLGCGFVGKVLARQLQLSGDSVTGWVRSSDSARELSGLQVHPFVGDFTDFSVWEQLPTDFQRVIHIASSGRGDSEVYKKVYLKGMEELLKRFPQAQKLFVSSTSVYGQTEGEWVDESSPTTPSSSTSQVLLEAESVTLNQGGIVVRPSGIYGPSRSVLFQKFHEGTAAIEGDGKRWVNQIHRDDVASGIFHLLQDPTRQGIYNLTDDLPTCHQEIYQWLSDQYQKPLPPPAPHDYQRKRGWTHKRISNQKMKSLGWLPMYPTFREGYATLVSISESQKSLF